ncbi:MAG: cyclophilin-like fold protein [Alkalispirochaeta sp.]
MARRIILTIDGTEFPGALNDSITAEAIAGMLPLDIPMGRWGDEYYGDIGRTFDLEPHATEVVSVGELAYWPPGSALCIFFGPTPASVGVEPRAASEVNRVGTLEGDFSVLATMDSFVRVRVALA